MPDLDSYLDQICSQLGFCPAEVRLELNQHIEQTAAKLEAAGHQPDEALRLALTEFGDPAEIAAGLAEVHKQGGAAMFRRVLYPVMLAVGVWLGVFAIALLEGLYLSWVLGEHRMPGLALLVSPLGLRWLIFPAVFIATHQCASRGGTRRECLFVGFSPLLAHSAIVLYLVSWVFAPDLGLFAREPMTMGAVMGIRGAMRDLFETAGTCLAATWLYFFVARHMRERPFWLAAEEEHRETQR